MQVNIQNIQRPLLFQEFFHKLITYSNEVIEYINTSTCCVTPISSKTNSFTKFIKTTIKSIINKSITYISRLKTVFT